jgi:hypothetical protein
MSFDTHRTWFYETVGRNIHLWQWVDTAATDTVGSYRVKLPAEYYGKQLIYPDESITAGLRFEGTAFIEPFVDVDPNELDSNANPELTGETAEEGSHVNLSRMMSLAVVDYVKAMVSDMKGDVERKEYYMREFWKKVADNESNKRIISVSFPTSPFAVR